MIKMIEPLAKEIRTKQEYDGWVIFCPGCKQPHVFREGWHFNGNKEFPTFSPSLIVMVGEERCHSVVTRGKIHFLKDCTHHLADKTVWLPILEE